MPPVTTGRVAALLPALTLTALLALPGTAFAQDKDCRDFQFQEDAQAVLDQDRSDPHRLDGLSVDESDGIACESLPWRESASDDDESDIEARPVSDTEQSTGEDRDCADFSSQSAAQAALEPRPGDPENLDADDDGIACEEHFGVDGQQVQVRPVGGVDTGGDA
jgi:hypothetical protein